MLIITYLVKIAFLIISIKAKYISFVNNKNLFNNYSKDTFSLFLRFAKAFANKV
jgi:hypothetical protein